MIYNIQYATYLNDTYNQNFKLTVTKSIFMVKGIGDAAMMFVNHET